ncbi:MAG: hypothetical protein HN929_10930 [Chloroflexi bacterium]|nr:hypothetical protein [Chloroflexota bacterium]
MKLTDDTRIQVIVPNEPLRWVTLATLREYLNNDAKQELTPVMKAKAAITRTVKKVVNETI